MQRNGSQAPILETDAGKDYFLTILNIHPNAAAETQDRPTTLTFLKLEKTGFEILQHIGNDQSRTNYQSKPKIQIDA